MLQERIANAIDRARLVWAAVIIFAAVYAIANFSVFNIIAWLIFAAVSYGLTILAVAVYFGTVLTEEDLNQELEEEPAPSVKMTPIDVPLVHGDVVARYKDENIYEWIEMPHPFNGSGITRFYFYSVTNYDRDGNVVLPAEDGIFLDVEGVMYSNVQPES